MGWTSDRLGNVITLQRGFDLPHRLRRPGAIPIITSSGREATHSEWKVKPPGVVTGRYGTIGQVYFIEEPFWPLNTALFISDFHGNDPLFVSYLLRTIDFHSHSGKSGVPGVNRNDLHEVSVWFPPEVAEQKSIARALSDADALIDSLEQLIAKKRLLKQGLMQELLNGKQRLPGFGGECEARRLDQLGRWVGGMTPSMRNPSYWSDGTIPWISSGDVKSVRLSDTMFSVSDLAIKHGTTTLLPARAIIVVTRSGILRKYLPVAMNVIPMAINQDIKALLPARNILPEFVLQALTYYGPAILARCLKSGTTVESIEFQWLKAFEILVPPYPEQIAISELLADMDAEIEALEAKLTKARHLKQGMAQQLLTGKIRLI